MRIIFLMLNLSDLNNPSGMYSDLIAEFVKNGHQVCAVAAASKKHKRGFTSENGAKVIRVGTLPLFNTHSFLKGIANILLPYQYEFAINKYLNDFNPDLIITPTPPVTLAPLLEKLKKRYNTKVYLILRDIFPQNAVDLSLIKKGSLIYRFFRSLEKKYYVISDLIGCMSEKNIDYIIRHNPTIDPNKLHILMNFQKTQKENIMSSELHLKINQLQNKFIVVFGGNMGKPQRIENIIELAKRCQVYNDVVFLFIGDGSETTRILKIADEQNVKNIKFMASLPRNEYFSITKKCHIGLISLNENFSIPNFPSKATSYFDAKLPILASIDKSTDFGHVLQNADAGLVSFAGDHDMFFENFKNLYFSEELREKLGNNGNKFFKKNMTVEFAYKSIMNYVQ